MSQQKKRCKKYRPKPCVLPLGMRRADKFEIPGYAAALALGQGWLCEQHVYDLLSVADLTRRCAPDGHSVLEPAERMVQACAAIQQRATEHGRYGVSGDEMRALREAIGVTTSFLRTVPNVEIARAAMSATAEFDRTGYLRV